MYAVFISSICILLYLTSLRVKRKQNKVKVNMISSKSTISVINIFEFTFFLSINIFLFVN